VFGGAHPAGVSEAVAAVVGLVGSAALLVCVALLLMPDDLGFSVKVGATYGALWDADILEQPGIDLALADAFEERRSRNAEVVARLVRYLAVALGALIAESAGFAVAAALAS
jgi:hypothetical protein